MLNDNDKTTIDYGLSHIEASIKDFGFAFMSYSGEAEVSYTVGQADRNSSDLLLLGVDNNKRALILDYVVKALGPDRIISEPCRLTVEGTDVMLVPMPAAKAVKITEVLKYRLGPRYYYKQRPEGGFDPDICAPNINVAQVLLPDAEGRFPGEEGCDPKVADAQDFDQQLHKMYKHRKLTT